MAVPSGPKGTRDFYPESMAFQEYLFSSWKNSCKRYSFEAYDGPMFEHLSVYTQKSGDEIEKQLYTFEDKGKRQLALRPEMTPTLARMVASKGPALKRPIRWYSIARQFRYEKMQKGRGREFYQLNMDILGSNEINADAELIAAAIDMMRDLGLTEKDFKARISSRILLEECFIELGLEKKQHQPLFALLDRRSKIPETVYETELAVLIPDISTRTRVTTLFTAASLDAIEKIAGPIPSITVINNLFQLLEQYGMKNYICFDINIVRGLAYYTGIVFEFLSTGTSMRAIAGGGRYDKLVGLYGGPPTPAVGFAAGDVVLGILLKEKKLLPPAHHRCTVYIIPIDENGRNEVIPCAQSLRNAGIASEFSFKPGNIGKQLKQADAAGAQFALFIGGEEAEKGCVRLKYMESGAETTIYKGDVIEIIQRHL